MFMELLPVVLALLIPLLVCYGLACLTVRYANLRLGQGEPQKMYFIFKDQEKFVEGFLWRSFHFSGARRRKGIELTVVDDGSQDDTGAILDRWATRKGCHYLDGSWEAINLDDLFEENEFCYDLRRLSAKNWRTRRTPLI